ncbi:DUF1540 domain-containing protein [Pelosinus sp. sgz500959]|uniref:DUF1540 domain-containing protein n=1 Tax=Pelosinus sp. sgz500959 TaxID=3242472 RepID=UPI0036702750
MVKINCQVTNCSHNKSSICYANCVDIVGSSAKKNDDTCCGSFLNKIHYSELTNNTLRLGACDCLKCTVETCAFNNNHLCTLDNIQVNGENVEYHTQTDCDSFKFSR